MSHTVLQRMSEKFKNFSENRAVYAIMRENYGTAKQATDDNTKRVRKYAISMPDNRGKSTNTYIHTLIMRHFTDMQQNFSIVTETKSVHTSRFESQLLSSSGKTSILKT